MSDAVLDNLALALLMGIPLALGLLAHLLFGVRRIQEREGRERSALWVANGLGLALCLTGLAAAGELYFRFAYDTTDAFGITRTTTRWIERHYRENANGMRDDIDYPAARDPDRRRVTFLGDSFTAGFGVPEVGDRFANLVRARRPGWEVHDLAENGWNTGAHLGILRAHPDYQLDHVVLVYTLNDISDIDPAWKRMRAALYENGRPTSFLAKHSYLFNLLHYRTLAWRSALGDYYAQNLDAYDGALWRAQRQRLAELASLVRGRGGELSVVTFPFLHLAGSDENVKRVHRKLARFWRTQGVGHLDLLPIFVGEDPDALVVNANDAHPNAYAHALAADAIVPFLEAEFDAAR